MVSSGFNPAKWISHPSTVWPGTSTPRSSSRAACRHVVKQCFLGRPQAHKHLAWLTSQPLKSWLNVFMAGANIFWGQRSLRRRTKKKKKHRPQARCRCKGLGGLRSCYCYPRRQVFSLTSHLRPQNSPGLSPPRLPKTCGVALDLLDCFWDPGAQLPRGKPTKKKKKRIPPERSILLIQAATS